MDKEQLIAQIEACRQMNADGTKAVYDLSTGIDFSRGKVVADMISKTIWEKDLRAFWNEKDGRMTFNAKYDLEIRLPVGISQSEEKLIHKISEDLEKDDMWKDLKSYLYDATYDDPSLGEFMLLGIWAVVLSAHENTVMAKEELARLYSEMSSHITFTR